MKKMIFWALALTPVSLFAQNNNFTLKLNITKYNAPAKAYFFYALDGKSKLDSASVIKGEATFNGNIIEPAMASLIVDPHGIGLHNLNSTNTDKFNFFIESGKIDINAKDSVKHATVIGSKINGEYLEYKKTVATEFKTKNDVVLALNNLSPEQKKDSTFRNMLSARYEKASNDIRRQR